MKRFVLGILVLALVLSAALPCVAAEGLSVNDAKAAAGQTLYLTVNLESPVKANTMGITCQFDKTLLSAQPELSSWAATGLLSAFEQDNMGAWAVSGVAELEGKLCVLAFRVKDGAAFDTTVVECTVKFKTDAQEVCQYTAKAQVSCVCAHQYGDWKSAGSMGHERVCSICGGKSTQSHDWDDGTEKKENDMTVITKTCLVCMGQMKTEIPSGSEGGQLVTPEQAPDHTHPQPSEGTQGNQIPDGVEVIIGEDGPVINKETGDVIVPGTANDLVGEDGSVINKDTGAVIVPGTANDLVGEDGSIINKDTGAVIVPGTANDLVVEDGSIINKDTGAVIVPGKADDLVVEDGSVINKETGDVIVPGTANDLVGADGSIINKDTGAVIVPGTANDLVGEDGHSHDDTITIGADQEHDHDHTPGGEDPVTLWVILAVLAVAVAGGVLFLKKKR